VIGAIAVCTVLHGRQVVLLRLVAMVALVILIIQSESLLPELFLMPFTAVTALVAFYEVL
jgi:hypothetical protein